MCVNFENIWLFWTLLQFFCLQSENEMSDFQTAGKPKLTNNICLKLWQIKEFFHGYTELIFSKNFADQNTSSF